MTWLALLALLAGCAGQAENAAPSPDAVTPGPTQEAPSRGPATAWTLPAPVRPTVAPAPDTGRPRASLPGGRRAIFSGNRFLVAYYGTAHAPSMGVLGQSPIATAHRRLMRAAVPFRRGKERIQPVYELIVTVADPVRGRRGVFSHDIDPDTVRTYLRAAHRNGALLLLDIQPGRSGFLEVARRWQWALRDPWVGLALDPEWRMGRRQVPGRVIGGVGSHEVNRTSAWLAALVHRHRLPQKLFVMHQFRTSMIRGERQIRPRRGLAMVQHVDGFGTPRQKLATYHAVVRARQFVPGLKLFYDQDIRRLGPAGVRRIRPEVRFVSFQ